MRAMQTPSTGIPNASECGLASGGVRRDGSVGTANFSVFKKLFSNEEAKRIRARLPPTSAFEAKPDSIDGDPTHEFYIYKAAYLKYPPLDEVMRPVVDRVLPFVRTHFACPSCLVCFSLIRRYLEDERRQLNPHQDLQAFVSVVFTLNSEEYNGGLYLMADYNGERHFIPLHTGDAVVHQADLLHGVAVHQGNRWSWSLWIKAEEDCKIFITVKQKFTASDADGTAA